MEKKLKQLLFSAKRESKALLACSVSDMIEIRSVAECSSYFSIPMIFNISHNAISYVGLKRIFNLFIVERDNAKVPFFIQLDHGKEIELIRRCIKLGFDAIMADGSTLSFEENVDFVGRVGSLKFGRERLLEAQLGTLVDTRDETTTASFTDPSKAKRFILECRADCLAISFGNEHNYWLDKREYFLDYDIPRRISRMLGDIPLVLHGADTISNEEIKKCVETGITKLNYGPFIRQSYMKILNLAPISKERDPRRVFEFVRLRLISSLKEKFASLDEILYHI